MAKTLEIVIKATDAASPVFRRVAENVAGSADRIRKAGDIADLGGVKKAGKLLGDYGEVAGVGSVREQGDTMRAKAQEAYAAKVKETVEIERVGMVLDKARAGALQERAAAAATLQRELKQINAAEQLALRTPQTGPGAHAEIRDTGDENRAVAERQYQEVARRTLAVEQDAKASDVARTQAIRDRRAAAVEYGRTTKQIADAEKAATKEALAGSRLTRGAAAAGGTLLALKLAGDLAVAYDKANEKFEAGLIASGREFAGEMAKSLPLVGGIVQGFEQAMLVVSGVSAELRKANAEAAELDKRIAGQNKARGGVDAAVAGTVGINDNERQKVERASDAELKKIRDARDKAKGEGVLDGDRSTKLDGAEAAVIEKRRQDIAKIENAADEDRQTRQRSVGDRIIEGEKRIADGRRAAIIAGLREVGRDQDADLAEVNAKYDDELAAIRGRRQDVDREKGLSFDQRVGLLNANDKEMDASNRRRANEVRAVGKQGATNVAERVDQVKRETLDAQASAGDPAAARELKILEIKAKYLAIAKEIDAVERNGNLTAEQRAEIETRKQGIATAAKNEIDQAGAGATVTEQGKRFAGAVDGRFTRETVAARSQVDVYRDQIVIAKKTADNTKDAADASKRAAKASEDLLSFLRGLPSA